MKAVAYFREAREEFNYAVAVSPDPTAFRWVV